MTHAHQERILDVLDPEQWLTRATVRDLTRMDTAVCGWTLTGLVAQGVVEQTTARLTASTPKGRPTHLYRLAKRGRGSR